MGLYLVFRFTPIGLANQIDLSQGYFSNCAKSFLGTKNKNKEKFLFGPWKEAYAEPRMVDRKCF